MTLQAALYHNRERNRSLRRGKKFTSLISSPFDLGTVAAGSPSPNPLVLPAASFVGISFSSGVTASELTVAVGLRTIGTKALAADEIFRLGFFERAFSLVPTSDIAGTVTLYRFDQWFRASAIATGVFT